MVYLISPFLEWKKNLNLPQPGAFEQLHRDARNVSLTHLAFEGGKADLAKGLSANFQVSHAFSVGSMMMPPTYSFGSIYVAGKHLMHGLIDTNGVFQGKYHFSFTKNLTGKLHTQIMRQAGQSMLQSELDYLGADYSLNFKAINPNLADGSGIFTASLLQSISQRLALGGELVAQKLHASEPVETGVTLAAKYSPSPASILTLNLQQFVALQASYFHKVSERVELGSELQMLLFGPRREAITTVSAKFDYRQACIRTQLDSTGKVGLLYEERLFPGFSLLLSGELDHVKNQSRFGIGLNLEN